MIRELLGAGLIGILLLGPIAASGAEPTPLQPRSVEPAAGDAASGGATPPWPSVHRPSLAPTPQLPPAPAPVAAPKPYAPPPGPKPQAQPKPAATPPKAGGQPAGAEGNGGGNMVQCTGCSPVASPLLRRGEAVIKYLREHGGDLPPALVRLTGAEIDGLLRGKSWSSAVLSGTGLEAPYQRLLAFDRDGRGRWLNFLGGIRGYSTLCRYEVDEDLLCLACDGEAAQCSALYVDPKARDFTLAFDPERGQLEVYDWILKSRWDDDRFLAPH